MSDLTPEQQKAIDNIIHKMEESKKHDMRCIVCEDMTRDRGIVCTGPAPSVPIIIGLCYPCKNLPGYEDEVKARTVDFLIEKGRYDLLQWEESEDDETTTEGEEYV